MVPLQEKRGEFRPTYVYRAFLLTELKNIKRGIR